MTGPATVIPRLFWHSIRYPLHQRDRQDIFASHPGNCGKRSSLVESACPLCQLAPVARDALLSAFGQPSGLLGGSVDCGIYVPKRKRTGSVSSADSSYRMIGVELQSLTAGIEQESR